MLSIINWNFAQNLFSNAMTTDLKVKKEKCSFILGYKIDGVGLHSLDKHINAIKIAHTLQYKSEL